MKKNKKLLSIFKMQSTGSKRSTAFFRFALHAKKFATIETIGIKLKHISKQIRKRNSVMGFVRNVPRNSTLNFTMLINSPLNTSAFKAAICSLEN